MLTYTTSFQMKIIFVMIPMFSTTCSKPVLYVTPLRKKTPMVEPPQRGVSLQ